MAEPRSAAEMSEINSVINSTDGFSYWIGMLMHVILISLKNQYLMIYNT